MAESLQRRQQRTKWFRTLALISIAAITLSCRTSQLGWTNAALHPLPQGAGRVAAKEAAKLVVEILTECNTHFPIPWSADVSARGVAGSYRVNRQLKVGFWPNSSLVRIESVPQTTADAFVLLISGGVTPSTTLLLDNGRRVFRSDRALPLLGKVLGVPFHENQLDALLRGCYPTEFGGIPTLYGEQQLLIPYGANGRAYYQREAGNGPWRLQTLFHPGNAGLESAWRMDLFDRQAQQPRRFVVNGIDAGPVRLDIRVSNVVAASLPLEMFEPKIPSASQPISLDDINLRQLYAP